MTKSVSIRLGTEGKARVKADWAEVRQAGEAAFEGVAESARRMGAANDAEFNRMAAGYDRAVAEMEAADRRRARAADKLNAIAPKSSVQSTIDASVGTGYGAYAGSARASADVLRDLLALQEAQEAKAIALRAVIDPLGAAQARYNAELAETRALQAAGHITAEELAQAEGLLKKQLDEVTAGGHETSRMGTMLGAQFAQMGQQIAAGGSALQAIAIQLPDISVLLSNTRGEAGAFASFIGGPWGIALTTGIAVAAALGPEILGIGDDAKEATSKTYDFSRGIDVLSLSAKNATDAMQQLADATKAAIAEQGDFLNQQAAVANASVDQLESRINARSQQMAQMRKEMGTWTILKQVGLDASDIWRGYQLDQMKSAQAADEDALALAKQAQANGSIAQAEREVASSRDAATAATNAYNVALGKLNQLREDSVKLENSGDRLARATSTSGYISDAEYKRRLNALMDTRDRALKTAEDAKRAAAATGGSSNQAGVGDMSALLKQLFPGVRITSTTGGQHVKGSDHYVGRAIDFVPAGGMGQYSKAEVEKMLTDAGVDIRRNAQGVQQFFGPGDKGHNDHFHVAWQGSPSPESAQRIADRTQRERERAQEEQVRRQRDYDQATADLDIKLLQLRRDSLTDTQSIAVFEKQQIAVEADKYKLGVEAKVKLGDLTRAQADELENANAFVVVMRQALVDRKAMADKLRQEAANDDAISESKLTILQAQDSLAKTARERRDIELEILDQQKEEARRRYQLTIDLGKLGEATADQVKAAEEGLKNLDTVYGARRTGVMKETAGPLESYADSMDLSKQQIYEKVQGYAVDELEYFRKGLDDAITSKLGIKDPALTSLIDLLVEQLLIKPLTDVLTKVGSEAGSSGSGGGGLLASIGSAVSKFVSSIFAGGNAIGTEHSSGGYTWLAENGPELVNLPKGAKVTPAAQTRRILSANDNAGRIVIQQFDLTKTVTTEELMRDMQARSDASAQQMMQAGFAGLIDQNKRSYGRLLSQG